MGDSDVLMQGHHFNKYTFWCTMSTWELTYLLLSFAVNLKFLFKKSLFLSWYLFPIRRKDNRILLSFFYYIIISLSLDIQLCSLYFFSIFRIIFPLCFNYENICMVTSQNYSKKRTLIENLLSSSSLQFFSSLFRQFS